MRRKTILWLISLLCVGIFAYEVIQWSKHRSTELRNRTKAQRACKRYRKAFKRPCKVKRGLVCGTGWQKIASFKYPNYLACRRGFKNESLKKAKNALRGLHPLVSAYKLYMARISKGRWLMDLPPKLRKLYQPHFRVPLSKIRVGTSEHIKMSAITDCYRIFFRPEMNIFRQLRAGIFSDKESEVFFLHELAHAEQCFKAGGRNNYARKWFRHLGKSVIRNILQKKKLNSENIHKQQPMEKEAERKAIKIQQKTNNHWKG